MGTNWLKNTLGTGAAAAVVALGICRLAAPFFIGDMNTVEAATLVSQKAQDSFNALPQRFTAVAQSIATNRPGEQIVEIRINHWSTDGQRDRLLSILRSGNQQQLLEALQKLPVVGTIRTPDTLAYDLHYARHEPWDDGGEQVLIATDRPIGFWEASRNARSLEYPFTVIQMRVKGNGQGEGRMSVATKVVAAGKEIVLENYDLQPVTLSEVKREK